MNREWVAPVWSLAEDALPAWESLQKLQRRLPVSQGSQRQQSLDSAGQRISCSGSLGRSYVYTWLKYLGPQCPSSFKARPCGRRVLGN